MNMIKLSKNALLAASFAVGYFAFGGDVFAKGGGNPCQTTCQRIYTNCEKNPLSTLSVCQSNYQTCMKGCPKTY